MHFVERHIVDARFRFTQVGEHALGRFFDRGRNAGLVDQLENGREAAVVMVVRVIVRMRVIMDMIVAMVMMVVMVMITRLGRLLARQDMELGGGNAIANHLLGPEFGAQAQVLQPVYEFVGISPGVNQRTDCHIAANA
jgi:hypothetical protein